ncbi:MAG: 2-C-methyl-D-erythritol 4-phosphate cytidylyltransferase [Phocaeicola sp.]|nr:2-C-methyl-D-erythritol 4-phosphate cytidylyltransferase [Prevotellaceae bacterium]MDY3913545.1 2-C-methyl-D-erythritol 4-phosphate cytidylyltransferase [Phocaeicola sp.]MDY5938302.1 2-C-methyl-D-erythritol 4-phosphate cytidylyltransferase [Phocaeicola sp.]
MGVTARVALIVAGGKGLRMGSELPKQFIPVGGKPVLMHTLSAFHRYDSSIRLVLVLPESQMVYWKGLCEEYAFSLPHEVVAGGDTRFQSVKNGLSVIAENTLVAVHDGVRPFVSTEVIGACFEKAATAGAVIPVVDVVETLRYLPTEKESKTVDRSTYKLVQTPQTFQTVLLKRAYAQPYEPHFTDDASVVESLGHPICLVAGNRENIKLTTPFDLVVAEALLAEKRA